MAKVRTKAEKPAHTVTTGVSPELAKLIDDSFTAYNLMNGHAARICNKIGATLTSARDDLLRAYYNVGGMINDLREDVAKYGNGADALVFRVHYAHQRTLQRAAQFAATYSEAEFEALLRCRVPDEAGVSGYGVSWGHMASLLTVYSAPDRKTWAERIVAERLSPADLRRLLLAASPKNEEKAARGGRPRNKPRTLDQAVGAVAKSVSTLQADLRHIDGAPGASFSVFESLASATPGELSRAMLIDIAEIVPVAEDVVSRLQALTEVLRAASVRLVPVPAAAPTGKKATTVRKVPVNHVRDIQPG